MASGVRFRSIPQSFLYINIGLILPIGGIQEQETSIKQKDRNKKKTLSLGYSRTLGIIGQINDRLIAIIHYNQPWNHQSDQVKNTLVAENEACDCYVFIFVKRLNGIQYVLDNI